MTGMDAKAALAALQRAMSQSDRAAINRACSALIESDAPLGGQWKAIATVLQHNGEHRLAERAAAAWVRQSGGAAAARFERAGVLALGGRLAEAEGVLTDLPANVPSPAANAFMRGTIATNLGRAGDARAHLRRAVGAQPTAGQAWLALAMAGRIATEDAVALERAGAAMAASGASERSAWLYAIGKLHDERGDHDRAFAAFDEGAALMRRERRYDAAADAAGARAAWAGWTAQAIGAIGADVAETASARPIFVTGLPRSGTTLVEQILASHSVVAGGEELGLFRIVAQDVGGRAQDDVARYLAKGGTLAALRSLYLRLAAERFSGAGRVIDKTLDASRHLGLIAALFPDAPIVWLRRDPLDCAWSAYRNWFLRGLDWSWSLTDIAAHIRIEEEGLEHWQAVLGTRILVVDYGRLVQATAPEIDRIAAHCGLASEPAMFEPHKAERAVTTTSVAQVREPINARGLGSAAPYRKYLQPFVDAYRTAGGTID